MSALCWSSIRGKVARVTRTDSCCKPISSTTCGQVVTDGFIKVEYSTEIEAGEDITVKNADGALCITDRGCDHLKWVNVNIDFCRVDPDLFTFMTGLPTVLDAHGVSVGNRVNTSVNCENGFSLETWSDIPGQACSASGGKSYGYFLVPCITHATLDSFTIENNAATFTLKGFSKAPSSWGRGPFDVVDEDGNGTPGPLLTAIQPTEHLHMQLTTIAPPTASCGCIPLTVPAARCSAATAVTGTSATLNGQADFAPVTGTARIVYGTSLGGPYILTAVSAAGTNTAGQVLTGPVAGLTAGTTYYYVTQILDSTSAVVATSSECSVTTTAALPSATCAPATGVTATQASVSGTGTNVPVGGTLDMAYGTTTGGPYGLSAAAAVPGTNTAGQPVSGTITGLTAATQYFYVTRVFDATNTMIATSTECTFTTTAAGLAARCSGAQAITATSASLTGQGDMVPPADHVVFVYGTTAGGPYPSTSPGAGTGNNTINQGFAVTVAGLTTATQYFYITQVLDGANNVLTSSTECTFATL